MRRPRNAVTSLLVLRKNIATSTYSTLTALYKVLITSCLLSILLIMNLALCPLSLFHLIQLYQPAPEESRHSGDLIHLSPSPVAFEQTTSPSPSRRQMADSGTISRTPWCTDQHRTRSATQRPRRKAPLMHKSLTWARPTAKCTLTGWFRDLRNNPGPVRQYRETTVGTV